MAKRRAFDPAKHSEASLRRIMARLYLSISSSAAERDRWSGAVRESWMRAAHRFLVDTWPLRINGDPPSLVAFRAMWTPLLQDAFTAATSSFAVAVSLQRAALDASAVVHRGELAGGDAEDLGGELAENVAYHRPGDEIARMGERSGDELAGTPDDGRDDRLAHGLDDDRRVVDGGLAGGEGEAGSVCHDTS